MSEQIVPVLTMVRTMDFYVFDCDVEDYEEDLGYGSYDVIHTYWFETVSEEKY
jgi:hypothetical protein